MLMDAQTRRARSQTVLQQLEMTNPSGQASPHMVSALGVYERGYGNDISQRIGLLRLGTRKVRFPQWFHPWRHAQTKCRSPWGTLPLTSRRGTIVMADR